MCIRDSLKGSLIENYEHVNVYDGQAVVGTEEGFSLVRFSSTAVGKEKLSLQIRRVYLTGRRDSLIYGRSYHYTDCLLYTSSHGTAVFTCFRMLVQNTGDDIF